MYKSKRCKNIYDLLYFLTIYKSSTQLPFQHPQYQLDGKIHVQQHHKLIKSPAQQQRRSPDLHPAVRQYPSTGWIGTATTCHAHPGLPVTADSPDFFVDTEGNHEVLRSTKEQSRLGGKLKKKTREIGWRCFLRKR